MFGEYHQTGASLLRAQGQVVRPKFDTSHIKQSNLKIKIDRPILKERRGWARARELAGLGKEITPHIMRHTCATWLMQLGIHPWGVSGFTGMSKKTLMDVYDHHRPDFQKAAANAL